jgi:hypothetical protein
MGGAATVTLAVAGDAGGEELLAAERGVGPLGADTARADDPERHEAHEDGARRARIEVH